MKMKVRLSLEIEVNGDATFDEVEEYLKFETCFYGCCSANNPFLDEDSGCDCVIEKFEIEEL